MEVFFEKMVISAKTLLRKTLHTAKVTYEELQTVFYEVEQIINNRPITYYYSDNEESCLTPNHLLYGRTLKYSDLLSDSTPGELITPKKLEESYKPATTIQIGDVVVNEEGNMPRSSWRLGKVEGLI